MKAIRYASNNWKALNVYTTDGRLTIDNNMSERTVRMIAIGRKNWLFIGSEAAGYRMSTVYVPCIGAHYTNMRYVASFDPANPSELLFDGTTPDAKIVGLSYLVWHPGGPPAGFAGPNDHFHQHNANGGLCLAGGTVVGGENVSAAQCAARGGTKSAGLMKDVWMEHAWVAPGWECSWGVFAGECPELGGKLGGSAFSK